MLGGELDDGRRQQRPLVVGGLVFEVERFAVVLADEDVHDAERRHAARAEQQALGRERRALGAGEHRELAHRRPGVVVERAEVGLELGEQRIGP